MSLNLIELIPNGELFFCIDFHNFAAFLRHGSVPEHITFHLLIADPAVVLLFSDELPLASTGNVILVVEVATQDQLGGYVDEFVLSCSILHDPFSVVNVLNLNSFSKP